LQVGFFLTEIQSNPTMPQPLSKMTDPYDDTSNTDDPGSRQRHWQPSTFTWGAPAGYSQGSTHGNPSQTAQLGGATQQREFQRGVRQLNPEQYADQDDDLFTQHQSSWDQVEDPFTQPQSHLTRDQFQSLSGLGNETSQVSLLASIAEGRARFLGICE
jgi:hypothetical protein